MIRPGSYWKHRHDGYEVAVTRLEELLTKAPGDANWHPAIAYQRTDHEDGGTYVRTADDFLSKFEARE